MSISLTKLTADVNAHQNLDNQPSLSASELKTAWDKPANDIKNYINNTLIEDLQTKVLGSTEINALINSALETITSAIATINGRLTTDEGNIGSNASAITALQGSLNSLTGRVSTLENTSGGSRTSTAYGLKAGITQTKDFEDTTKKNGQVWMYVNVLNAEIPSGSKEVATIAEGYRPSTTIKRKVNCGSNTGGGNSWFSDLYIYTNGSVVIDNQTGFPIHNYNFDTSFTVV